MPQPEEKGDDGWTSRYDCHIYRLARGVSIHVNASVDRSLPGYWVKFLDRQLSEPIEDLEKAKAAAFRFATKVLTEALEGLPK